MADWYSTLFKEGVEIHYASNGPQELFPVIAKFLDHGQFPLGSIRLKEYGGASSALAKLWEDPGLRKRAAVEEVILEFPYCRFILVGDSGEADLDLYLLLAQQYPKQILAIYIRDVTTPLDQTFVDDSTSILNDPTTDPLSPLSEEREAEINKWVTKFESAKLALPRGIVLRTFRTGDECKAESLRLMKGR